MKKICLFCRIIKKEIDEEPIWESEKYVAYLDRCPAFTGMTMVMPKEHHPSDIFQLPPTITSELFEASRTVAKLMIKKLKVKRVAIVVEGLGVDHTHIKLYPIHGLKKKFQETWSTERVFFKTYPGYLSTQLGPELTREELKKLSIKFKS